MCHGGQLEKTGSKKRDKIAEVVRFQDYKVFLIYIFFFFISGLAVLVIRNGNQLNELFHRLSNNHQTKILLYF